MLSKEMVKNVCGQDKHTGVRLVVYAFLWAAVEDLKSAENKRLMAAAHGDKEGFLRHYGEMKLIYDELVSYGNLMGNSA